MSSNTVVTPVRSTSVLLGEKLYTIGEDLWLPYYNDLGFRSEFRQKDGWYELLHINGRWWLHIIAGFRHNGANLFPDFDFMIVPSAKHDVDHWLIMHGIIPEENNNLIDKELEDDIIRQPLSAWKGGKVTRRIQARIIRRATNMANEKRNLAGVEDQLKFRRIPI